MVFYITRGNDTVTQTDITDALTYTPVNKTGDALSGTFTGNPIFSGSPIFSGDITLGDTISDTINVVGTLKFAERSDPPAPSTNQAVLYIRDDTFGKTQLCVRFATGAIQVLATQP